MAKRKTNKRSVLQNSEIGGTNALTLVFGGLVLIVIGAFLGYMYFASHTSPANIKTIPNTTNQKYQNTLSDSDASAIQNLLALHDNTTADKVTIDKVDEIKYPGKYVSGDYHVKGIVGGARWFVQNSNGEWSIIYIGNGIASCTEVAVFNAPKDFLPCYSPSESISNDHSNQLSTEGQSCGRNAGAAGDAKCASGLTCKYLTKEAESTGFGTCVK